MVPLSWCWYKYCAYAEFPRCFKRNPNYYPRQNSKEMHLLQSSNPPSPEPPIPLQLLSIRTWKFIPFYKKSIIYSQPLFNHFTCLFYFHRYFLLQDRAFSAHAHVATTYPIPLLSQPSPATKQVPLRFPLTQDYLIHIYYHSLSKCD